MSEYEIGKDIQEVKRRLEALERVLGTDEKSARNRGSMCHLGAIDLVEEENADSNNLVACKTGQHGRERAGDCVFKRQTLKVCSDGKYEHFVEHHNNSQLPDDGDEHEVFVDIRAGTEVIHSFESKRFVPAGRDREKTVSGQSDKIRSRYKDIDNFDPYLKCS